MKNSVALYKNYRLPTIKESLKYGWFITQGTLAYEAMLGVDKIILGIYRPISEVGQYSVAALLSRQLEIVGVIAFSVLMPKLASIQKSTKEEHKTILSVVRFNMIIGLLCVLVLYFISPYILNMMGKQFVSSNTEFLILAAGFILISMSSPFATYLQARGYEKEDRFILFLGFMLNMMILFFLVPLYGGIGAAISTAIGLTVVFASRFYYYFNNID